MRARLVVALTVALLGAGCVVVIPRGRPAAWPDAVAVSDERLSGRFTGAATDLAKTALVFFSGEELWGRPEFVDGRMRPFTPRSVRALEFDLHGERWSIRAEFADGSFVRGERLVERQPAAVTIERRHAGREGGSVARSQERWSIRPDAGGGLVFEHSAWSVGRVGLVPGGYHERRWWRLERTGPVVR